MRIILRRIPRRALPCEPAIPRRTTSIVTISQQPTKLALPATGREPRDMQAILVRQVAHFASMTPPQEVTVHFENTPFCNGAFVCDGQWVAHVRRPRYGGQQPAYNIG